MKICPNCNASIEDSATFCPACGANLGGNPNQQSGFQSGAQSGSQPGSQSGFQAGSQPGSQSGSQTGPQPGFQSGSGTGPQPQNGYGPNQGGPYYGYGTIDPYDHTSEFDPRDISENKVIAMLVYLWGVLGIIVALLCSNHSPYAAFHVRQALKFTVINALLLICVMLLFWTVIVPIAYAVISVILFVIKIICFFQICQGKAVEPYIIRSFGFLR